MTEKTHEATPRKLEEAARRGQVPRSKVLVAAGATAGALLGTSLFLTNTTSELLSFSRRLLEVQSVAPVSALLEAIRILFICSLPTLLGAAFGALIAGLPQTGLKLTPLQPKLEAINPIEGAKKLFSAKHLKTVAVAANWSLVVGWFIWNSLELDVKWLGLMQRSGLDASVAFGTQLRSALTRGAVTLVGVGLVDFWLERRRHRIDLRMDHQEMKQEHKNAEGDPAHKAKRRSLHRQLNSSGAARGVKHATAVVVNPTHLAIALRYAEHEAEAPYIVASARDDDALAIRREAQRLGVPVVRDIPLARSLIHYDVGEEIPEELYQAAAAVLKIAVQGGAR